MAKIQLTNGFSLIPEGVHIFCIKEVAYDDEFGKIVVKLVTAQGASHIERFSIKDKDDNYNEKALNVFSYFAKIAMNDFSIEEIDTDQLVNHYIKAEVIHTKIPSTNDPNKLLTFVKLGEKWSANGFEENVPNNEIKPEQPVKKLDLDKLLS